MLENKKSIKQVIVAYGNFWVLLAQLGASVVLFTNGGNSPEGLVYVLLGGTILARALWTGAQQFNK